MRDYLILTDSSCDISEDLLKQWGIPYCCMSVKFDEDENSFNNYDMPFGKFYDRMRSGSVARTAAVNMATFEESFEPYLKQGKDILYIGFSSGLSTTYHSAELAAEELREKYPDRKILTVDSLAASGGFGLLVYLAKCRKDEGADIEEVKKYVEQTRLNVCHWFTVDDLVYLKRGGRVSAAAALVGGILNIKPVLHVDNEGHLLNMFKARGRKASVRALAQKLGELVIDKNAPVFISHGDCIEDAELLKKILKEEFGVRVTLITDIGPVIGSHSGPGTLALFFVGSER